jgi:N-acetylmuramoyl-L-alanine amidase
VLIDLSQTATISASLRLGKEVLGRMGAFADLHNTKVEQARFVVLKSPDIPSILIETGFISNPKEERHLRDPKYQQRIADSVMIGVKEYFYERPPHDSWIALYGVRYYKVNPGDTLEIIAKNYHVSRNQIIAKNNLKDENIVVGQVLQLPPSTAVS